MICCIYCTLETYNKRGTESLFLPFVNLIAAGFLKMLFLLKLDSQSFKTTSESFLSLLLNEHYDSLVYGSLS